MEHFENLVLDQNFFSIQLGRKDGRSSITLLDTSKETTVNIRDMMNIRQHGTDDISPIKEIGSDSHKHDLSTGTVFN